MLKTYIFDFDGTLADTFELAVSTFNELSSSFNLSSLNEETILKLRDLGVGKYFFSLNMSPAQINEVISKLKQNESGSIGNIKLFPEMREVLSELKNKNIKLGILTSNSVINVQVFLDKNHVNYFDFVISGDDLFGKDAILKKIMEEHNLIPEETAYIGDEDRDMDAAKKAGLKSVAVTWGFNSAKLLQEKHPDYLINNPKELLNLSYN